MRLKSEVRKPIPVRLNFVERAQVQELADKYAGGNLAKWMRYAAMNCEPKKTDLEK